MYEALREWAAIYSSQLWILGLIFTLIMTVLLYEDKVRSLKERGKKMTGSIRAAHVRTLLCDRLSDALDKMVENDELTIEERIYWAQKLAGTGLADLAHRPKPEQLKKMIRDKRIEEGKPLSLEEAKTTSVISIIDQLKAKLNKKSA